MASVERPISPHLQIYKPQLTSLLSITHRGTGVFLSLGALGLTLFLTSAAGNPECYAALQRHLACWYGQLIILASMFSLFYHLCNGIRHLCWDAGMGLDLEHTYRSGYIVIAVSLLATAVTSYIAMCPAGGAA